MPVLFLHGDCSSATWWEETMLALPHRFWGIAPDLRGYGMADPTRTIDASLGVGDFAEDAVALLDQLKIDRAHIIGCSMGGLVVWRMMSDYPQRFLSSTLINPVSPFGYGGTGDARGTPNFPDFAGSGAGMADPDFVKQLAAGASDRESERALRESLRSLFLPPWVHPREDALLESLYQIHLGEHAYPGDHVPSPHWPYYAPGIWGSANACSPKYVALHPIPDPKQLNVKVLWIRGSQDPVIADESPADPAVLGRMGLIPGWPGEVETPPQPMVSQTRFALEKFAAAGGKYSEEILQDAGHLPFLDRPQEFDAILHGFLAAA